MKISTPRFAKLIADSRWCIAIPRSRVSTLKKKLALPQVVRVIIVISSNLTERMFSSYMFARRLTDWWHNYIVNYNVDACSQLRTSHWGMLFSFNGYQNCFSCWIIWKANFLSHGQFITQSGRRQSVLSYVFKFQTILTSQYTFLFTSMHESVALFTVKK